MSQSTALTPEALAERRRKSQRTAAVLGGLAALIFIVFVARAVLTATNVGS